jgi:hypothetical protein
VGSEVKGGLSGKDQWMVAGGQERMLREEGDQNMLCICVQRRYHETHKHCLKGGKERKEWEYNGGSESV